MSSPITLNLAPPTPNTLSQALSIAGTFPQGIASYQMGLTADFKFGATATGTAPVIPITNITDLALYWNAQPSAVGIAVQNVEVERFQNFNTTNHVFNATDMTLAAALEPGGTCDVVSLTLTAPVTAGNVLTFADTTGVVDSMMYSTSIGQTVSNIRVVSHDATTVTLSQNVTLPINANVRFLPFYIVPTVTAGTQITVLQFPAVPAAVQPGMFYANVNDGYSQYQGTNRVISTTATTVTLANKVNVSAAAFLYFQPPITSGQICSKASYSPWFNGATVIGAELTCQIPASANFGAWPAFWFYPFSGGNGDEIDVFEFFICLTANAGAYTSNMHFGSYNVNGYMRSVGSGNNHWSAGFYRPGTDFSTGFHKFQVIWTRDAVYRYIDDQLVIITYWVTTSLTPSQMLLDLACGSTLAAFLSIYLYPQTTAQFANMQYKIQEIKTWQA